MRDSLRTIYALVDPTVTCFEKNAFPVHQSDTASGMKNAGKLLCLYHHLHVAPRTNERKRKNRHAMLTVSVIGGLCTMIGVDL